MVQRAQIAVDIMNAATGFTPPIAANTLGSNRGVANSTARPP
jgi:hypothetical protein